MAGGQNSNGGVKWTAMSTIAAALITVTGVITVGYWQYFPQKSEGNREFRGRVIDAKTGKVLPQAKIVLESQGSPSVIYSDSEGIFPFSLEKANTQVRIRVEANGYEKYDRFINPAPGSGVEEIRVQPTQSSPQPASIPTPETSIPLSVSFFQPKSEGKIHFYRGADGVYRCTTNGTSSGLSDGKHGLLLWVRPKNPPSDTPGWYLQGPPSNGISRIETNGAWTGNAQLGNAQSPPQEGNIVDFAVTIADSETINKLKAEQEQDDVIKDPPVGVKPDTAQSVVVTLEQQ